jgi:anti-sigma B factor antagonist
MSDKQRCVEVLCADNVTILDLEGEIDIYTATELKEALLQAIAGGARRVLVDATKVTFMDSSGLSVLIGGEQRLRPLGGSLVVACSKRVERLLTVAGLLHVLARYPNRDEALRAALGQARSSACAPAPEAP